MTRAINLADPDFEPTDDELTSLSARAFAGVKASNVIRLAKLRADIARARAEVLRTLDAAPPVEP